MTFAGERYLPRVLFDGIPASLMPEKDLDIRPKSCYTNTMFRSPIAIRGSWTATTTERRGTRGI